MTRSIIITALTLALAGSAAAQETTSSARKPTTTSAPTASATTTDATTTDATTSDATTSATTTTAERKSDEQEDSPEIRREAARVDLRQEFGQLLARHPDELGHVLALEPELLSNEAFLARYPEVAQFLNAHPEIRRNPHYYLQDHRYGRPAPRSAFEQFAEAISIMFVSGLVVYAVMWLVRTFIEQKRWNHLARRQSEVHNKILDRLGSGDELAGYIKSEAGTKYLESAPIALHTVPPPPHTPALRVLRSIQLGVIVAAAGLGMLLVSARSTGDAEQGFFAMGVIAFCVGGGFIVSAAVSVAVARRLGIAPEGVAAVADEAGLMR